MKITNIMEIQPAIFVVKSNYYCNKVIDKMTIFVI